MSKERAAELFKDQSSVPNDKTPGLTLKQALGKAWDELAGVGAHGAHEAAAALFRGDAFVLYPHAQEGQAQENQGHGLDGQAMQQPEKEQDQGMER